MSLLRRLRPDELPAAASSMPDAATHATVAAILADVRAGGLPAAIAHAHRLGDLAEGQPWWFDRPALARAFAALPRGDQDLLQRVAGRIRAFAQAQRASLHEFELPVPGGCARQRIAPVRAAGCYAPGGRHPLPSSVLMTAVTARSAGVATVVVASPRPTPLVLAAAHAADADGLLAIGGAQAISALATGGGPLPRCDVIVGPGNRFVTAAKLQLAGVVGTDLPAGPSELVILADATADPATVAADLLAQAEHDPDARPFLVTTAPGLPVAVASSLAEQLPRLPSANAEVARVALQHGGAVLAATMADAIAACRVLAPEHLQVVVRDADTVIPLLDDFGALFTGVAAEVFGDYGAGPNHVLPTGGAARHCGGLSVFAFVRIRTELQMDRLPDELVADTVRLAQHEGLAAHAAAAARRLQPAAPTCRAS